MAEHRNEVEKVDEIMLPGFRFHPTDEELVGFYLKKKIQQRPLSIELIKQLDIYKYDPWDLPKLASMGEKEWYFYCPRDRKYRNSARPSRVTGAGFWKATGTDRPIYSSKDNKCIGLKKSLVFYKGRASKGIKTDWMMHEFRLPSLVDSATDKRFMDKSIPANDSWAICRILKKTISTTQRVLPQFWASTLPECSTTSDPTLDEKSSLTTQFTPQNMSLVTETCFPIHFDRTTTDLQQYSITNLSPILDHASKYKPLNSMVITKPPPQLPISNGDITNNFLFCPLETLAPTRCIVDVSSMLEGYSDEAIDGLNFGGSQQYNSNGFPLTTLPQVMQVNVGNGDENGSLRNHNLISMDEGQWENSTFHSSSIGFPFSSPMGMESTWRPNLLWDSPFFPSEVSSSFSTTKCYT